MALAFGSRHPDLIPKMYKFWRALCLAQELIDFRPEGTNLLLLTHTRWPLVTHGNTIAATIVLICANRFQRSLAWGDLTHFFCASARRELVVALVFCLTIRRLFRKPHGISSANPLSAQKTTQSSLVPSPLASVTIIPPTATTRSLALMAMERVYLVWRSFWLGIGLFVNSRLCPWPAF